MLCKDPISAGSTDPTSAEIDLSCLVLTQLVQEVLTQLVLGLFRHVLYHRM